MRICHVNLATGYSGGENQTLLLIKQQIKEGYQLTVVANPKSPFADKVRLLGCKLVLTTHFLKNHRKHITAGCDVIHVHEGRAIYWALIQSKLTSIPYIVTRRIDNPLKDKFLSRIAYSNASVLVGLSGEIVTRIRDKHPSKEIVKIPSSPVSYAVDSQEVAKIKEQFPGKIIVIQAAKLLEHKGYETALAAASILQTQDPNIQLVLLGDGPQEAKLKTIAHQQQLNNVFFAGKQSNMGDWFEAADIMIHPSYSEGLGSVILEAINAGLPVIGSRAGGIPDIIDDGVSGLLVEPRDENSLANSIKALSQDLELRTQLITSGQKKLRKFDISNTSKQYAAIYKTLIK
jgi:glycosyltransferase involved in cell wall biosynthesis